MKRLYYILFLFVLLDAATENSQAQNISSNSITTNLNYYTVATFKSGVIPADHYIELTNLQDNRDYTILIRGTTNNGSSSQGYLASSSGTNYWLPMNTAMIQYKSIINNSRANGQPTTVSSQLTSPTPITYFSSSSSPANNNRPVLVKFRTVNAQSSNDVYRIYVNVSGTSNLCVRGDESTNGFNYIGTITYDLWEASAGGSSWTSRDTETDNISINVKDGIEFTPLVSTVTIAAGPAITSAVTRDINNQFRLSSNEPVSLTVKAKSANLTSGLNSIPVSNFSVLLLNTTSPGTLYLPVYQNLSSVTDVYLAYSIARYLDNNISISYRLANPSTALAGKPSGKYSVVLTYVVTQF